MQMRRDTFSDRLTRALLRRIHVQYNAPPTASPTTKMDQAKQDIDDVDHADDGEPGVPATLDLNPDAVAKFLTRARARQPDDTHRADAQRTPQFPLCRMLVAARFAACFENCAQLTALGAPQALTCLLIPDRMERRRAWDELPNILVHLGHLAEDEDQSLSSMQTVGLGYRGSARSDHARAAQDFEDALELSIEKGKTIVALVPAFGDLPEALHPLVTHSVTLPPLCRTMVLDILRQTHALRDDIDADALLEFLPSDVALAKMPLSLFHTAFHRNTAEGVLRRLCELATVQVATRQTTVLTLDKIHLPPAAAAFCESVLQDLQSWQARTVLWSEVPSSACLYGPPGNGKTSLAAALAGSAEIPLVTTSYADCQRAGHQGDFLRVLSDKVTEAIMSAPCVFLIDELDSFGLRDKPGRNSDYVVGIVNGLLEHLSKLNDAPGVVTLGATNNPQLVDPAILRPGRFDHKIHLGDPDRAGILRILEIELGAQAQDLGAQDIAIRLLGVSGAQVSAVVRDARARARRAGADLQPAHLVSAVDHIAPPRAPTLLRRIAIHEAGHAVVGHCLGLSPPRHLQLSVNGGTYGYVMPGTMTVADAENHLATLMGGRAAEIVLLGASSNGADSDLAAATDFAINMRYRWGMRPDTLISISCDALNLADPSAQSAHLVNTDLRHAEDVSRQIIQDNLDLVRRMAEALVKTSALTGEDLRHFLNEAAEPK